MNRADFQQLADTRIAEAAALLTLAPPLADGAYYLAGYAVECALKACIAKSFNQYDWPEKKFVNDCNTHDLVVLFRLAGLETARENEAATNLAFAQNWIAVKDWNERSRYQQHPLDKAQKMVAAVSDPASGVLPWIKVHW